MAHHRQKVEEEREAIEKKQQAHLRQVSDKQLAIMEEKIRQKAAMMIEAQMVHLRQSVTTQQDQMQNWMDRQRDQYQASLQEAKEMSTHSTSEINLEPQIHNATMTIQNRAVELQDMLL